MTIVNHECYVSLEVAKLLKEAGFDWEVRCYYETSGKLRGLRSAPHVVENYNSATIWQNNGNTENQLYSAPTLDVAQRWLREVKYISVETGIDIHGEWKVLCCKYPINNEWPDDWCLLDDTDEANPSYSTYEEAQEAGIKKCLTLILEGE